MSWVVDFFSVNNIFFNIFGYGMSYLEFFGTLFNLWCVWLVSRNNIWNWLIGNVGVILFLFLFYQIRLYSDFFEQIYFLITGFYGWWFWLHGKRNVKEGNLKKELAISVNSKKINYFYVAIVILGTLILGLFMSYIHLIFSNQFPEPASFPYLDAFTTVMSFAATILMAHKKIECWYLWIIVDVIGVGLYYQKEVVFISFLYFIFLFLAVKGLVNWKKILIAERVNI